MLIEKGPKQLVDDGDIPLKDLKKYTEAIELYKQLENSPEALDTLDNYWIYGPSGTGKSLSSRRRFPDHYVKSADTEWFTGYNGQTTIIWDDFEPFNKSFSGLLKRAADHYPFQARVHGNLALIRPKRIVITSNYHPSQIWQDSQQLEPILRRFKVHQLTEDKYDMQPAAPEPRPILAQEPPVHPMWR